MSKKSKKNSVQINNPFCSLLESEFDFETHCILINPDNSDFLFPLSFCATIS